MEFSLNYRTQIIKKLKLQKSKITKEASKSKLEFAAGILNLISKEITENSAYFALDILKVCQIYLDHLEFLSIDKLILKISQRYYIPELFNLIKNREHPEIKAGICYIKFKHFGIFDNGISECFHLLNEGFQRKMKEAFGGLLAMNKREGCTTNQEMDTPQDALKGQCTTNQEIINNDIGDLKQPCIINIPQDALNNSSSTSLDHIKTDSIHDNTELISIINKVYDNDKINSIKDVLSQNQWNKFTILDSKKNKDSILYKIASLLNDCKIKKARKYLFLLKKSSVIYNLISLTYLLTLEYPESIMYINLAIDHSPKSDMLYHINCKLLIENIAKIPSLTSNLKLIFCKNIDRNDYNNVFENKLMMSRYLNGVERVSLFGDKFYDSIEIINRIKKIHLFLPEFSIIYISSRKENILLVDVINNIHNSVRFDGYLEAFGDLMTTNQAILKTKPTTPEDKTQWWMKRINLDKQLGDLLKGLKSKITLKTKKKILFILDDEIANFPWEGVFDKVGFRILSFQFCFYLKTKIIDKIFYLLDPANNLKITKETISTFIKEKTKDSDMIEGITGRGLKPEENEILNQKSLFMYFGHGTGRKHFDIKDSNPECIFLFGCSSCKLITTRGFKSNGYILRHINQNKVAVGNLWDVTDKDLDLLTVSFLNDFFGGKCMLDSAYRSREACKLKYLNGYAFVVYGLFKSIELVQ